jgi:hypothetical protein
MHDTSKDYTSPIDESSAERTIRNFLELLQGFRVAVTGVQVFFAFLLTVPFTPGYGRLTAADRWLFYVALVGAAVASVLFIAPVAQHRVLFRQGRKEALLRQANRYGIVGSLAMATSMTAATLVVVGYLFSGLLAPLTAAGFALLCGWLWFAKPLLTRLRGSASAPMMRQRRTGERPKVPAGRAEEPRSYR